MNKIENDQIRIEVLKVIEEKKQEKRRLKKEWVVKKINEENKPSMLTYFIETIFVLILKMLIILLMLTLMLNPTLYYADFISKLIKENRNTEAISCAIIFLILTPFWLYSIYKIYKIIISILPNLFKRIEIKPEDLSDKEVNDFLINRKMNRCCNYNCHHNEEYNWENYEEEFYPETEFEFENEILE